MNVTCVTWTTWKRLAPGLILLILPAFSVLLGVSDSEILVAQGAAAPNCTQTQIPGKCGTDLNLQPNVCGIGQPTCYFTIISYGNMENCTRAEAGLTECTAGTCDKIVISQICQNGSCVANGHPDVTTIRPTSYASGAACSTAPAE